MQNFFSLWSLCACAFFAMTTFAVAQKTDSASANKVWVPTEYPISFWCGPPEEFLTRARFQEIKDAGFTHVMPPCGGSSLPEYNRKVLELSRQVGLKTFIHDSRMTVSLSAPDSRARWDAIFEEYRNFPALAGYHLADEPGASAFPGLAEVTAYQREKDPKHPIYINLLPNYASPGMLGTATYDEHLRRFAQEVQPFALSYDHYHFTNGGDGPLFYSNLAAARKVAAEQNLPFWNIVLVTQHGPYRNLSEGELRYEAMQTLAYGGKGLLWFTYWQPTKDPSFIWEQSMILADGTRSPHYEMVKGINHEVRAIGKQLLNATSTSVFHDGKIPNGGVRRNNEPIRAAGKGDFTMGMFRDATGKKLALIANTDYRNAATSEFLVSAGRGKVQQFNASTRRWNYVSGASAKPDGDILVSLQLSPGGAALLRW